MSKEITLTFYDNQRHGYTKISEYDIEELKINLNLDDFNPIPIEDKPLNTEKRCPHCDMLLWLKYIQ